MYAKIHYSLPKGGAFAPSLTPPESATVVCPHTIKILLAILTVDTTHMTRSSLAFHTESNGKLGGV